MQTLGQRAEQAQKTLSRAKIAGLLALMLFTAVAIGSALLPSSSSRTLSTTPSSDDAGNAAVESEERWEARDALKLALKDAKSAEYRGVFGSRVGESYFFCGWVNAKNGFGAYTGFERFVALRGVAMLDDGSAEFQGAWTKMCGGVRVSGWS